MLSKWFFQQQFAKYDLVLIAAAACSLRYPRIGCCNENRMITLYCLNTRFYQDTEWGATKQHPNYFKPYATISKSMVFISNYGGKRTEYNIGQWIETEQAHEGNLARYYRSISKEGGYFSPRILQAYETKVNSVEFKPLPIVLGRYNPAIDDGKGNKIYLQTIMNGHWGLPQKTPDYIIEEVPLWLGFWGYYNYLKQTRTEAIFPLHMFVVQSKYIQTQQTETPNNFWAFIDNSFIQGKNPWDSAITYSEQKLWFPTVAWQLKTINAICESGPYVPKLDNQTYSTWELATHYSFHFKWGGPTDIRPTS